MGKPTIRFEGYTDDWEQRKLDDVVEFLDTMRKPLEGAKRISGPYPYYGASGIVDYVDGYLFDEELILLSEDGANITDRNYPVCFLASGKYWVNNHAHVLRTKHGYFPVFSASASIPIISVVITYLHFNNINSSSNKYPSSIINNTRGSVIWIRARNAFLHLRKGFLIVSRNFNYIILTYVVPNHLCILQI